MADPKDIKVDIDKLRGANKVNIVQGTIKRRIKIVKPCLGKYDDPDEELETSTNEFLSSFDGDEGFEIIDIKYLKNKALVIYKHEEL